MRKRDPGDGEGFQDGVPKDPRFRRKHRRVISVMTRVEARPGGAARQHRAPTWSGERGHREGSGSLFLGSDEVAQHPVQLVNALLQARCMLGD